MSRPWEQQPWAAPYRAAMFERDEDKLPARIKAARKAIELRIAELCCSSKARSKDVDEMGALQDALNVLTLLEKHEALRKRVA